MLVYQRVSLKIPDAFGPGFLGKPNHSPHPGDSFIIVSTDTGPTCSNEDVRFTFCLVI